MTFVKIVYTSLFAILVVSLTGAVAADAATEPTTASADHGFASQWFETVFNGQIASASTASLGKPGAPPISFRYRGTDSAILLPKWKLDHKSSTNADGSSADQFTYTDPDTGLQCVIDCTRFTDSPAIEWVVHFRNGGQQQNLLEDIEPLDVHWKTYDRALLIHSLGSHESDHDFLLTQTPLEPHEPIDLVSGGGRSSDHWLPFFNLDCGNDRGVISAIGWSGQWAAHFETLSRGDVWEKAGMQLTHLVLEPGEEIISPRMLVLFYEGPWIHGNNLLRHFILLHDSPRQVNGRLVEGPISLGTWGGSSEQAELDRIATVRREKAGFDTFWVDAGWYGPPSPPALETQSKWYENVGNWTINPTLFPQGLRPISDAAARADMQFLLWLEPERAVVGTSITREHPQWFLGKQQPGANLMLNLGLPEAEKGIEDLTSRFIEDYNVKVFRTDFNYEPLEYWRNNDPPDCQGMTEIRYVQGLYKFWDGLRSRHPGLQIDDCASGGRRIDLETIGRSIPLWQSDYQGTMETFKPIGGQVQMMGLSPWVIYHGTAAFSTDWYVIRSNYGTSLQCGVDPPSGPPERVKTYWDLYRKVIAESKQMRPYWLGDYYPLTPCNLDEDAWAAFQLNREDLQEGCVLAFRREKSGADSQIFSLKGLAPAVKYVVTDSGSGEQVVHTGDELTNGFTIKMDKPASSRLFFYSRVRE